MKFEKIDSNKEPDEDSIVQLKKMGNIFEIRSMSKLPTMPIKKIDKEHFVEIETGEVKAFNHNEKRIDNLSSIAQSIKHIREYINANITDPKKTLFITLTYAENMQEPDKLYQDFRKFNMRLKYYLNKNKLPSYEYFLVIEPQGRGSLHGHLLLIFKDLSPYIENDKLAEIWGHGFVKINSLKNVDNVGAYLSAYLSDMEFNETVFTDKNKINDLKLIEAIDENGTKQSKAIIKGARLKLYPKGFRIFRKSKGIIPPEIITCTYSKAKKEIGDSLLTFEKTIKVTDNDGKLCNIINYRHYKKKQDNGGVLNSKKNE